MAPLLLLLPVVQLLLAVADAVPDSCAKATCAGHEIHYPFRLDSSMPDDCVVYPVPGIGLICQDNSTLILPFESHRYTVLSINYKAHTILVSDADIGDEYAAAAAGAGCPRLHVNLTIDAFWLRLSPSDSNITFLYNCKRNVTLPSAVELSGCQDGNDDDDDDSRSPSPSYSYALRDGGVTGAEAHELECQEVVVAPVLDVHKRAIVGAPGGPPPPPGDGSSPFREVLQGGFELSYDTHSRQCDRCERSGGWCGYQRAGATTPAAGASATMTFTCFCESGPASDRCGTCVSPLGPFWFALAFLLVNCFQSFV